MLTHTTTQIQATHCLSSLHPGPALAVTRCHPKSISTIYYLLVLVLIAYLSLGLLHTAHKNNHVDEQLELEVELVVLHTHEHYYLNAWV